MGADDANMSNPPAKIEDHRRKWDKDEYEARAKERLDAERLEQILAEAGSKSREPPVKRELLRPRDYHVDLDSKLGKSQVITKTTPSSGQGGYYCNVCDCVVKDSINFLDHINGKKHQRNLGMSMRVERSSLDQVKARFALNKKKMEEKRKEYDLEQKTSELREEEEKLREYRREKKEDKKRKLADEDHSGMDPDMMAMMGFGGFGGSKKN